MLLMATKRTSTRRKLTSFTAWQFYVSFVTFAIGFAVFGITVSVRNWQNDQISRTHAAQKIAAAQQSSPTAQAADAPSVVPPTPDVIKEYSVPADAPRYIDIPRLGVHARVLSVGLARDGSIATPGNVHDAAWYTGSVKPGQQGTALIDGHVSSWTSHGVFYNLTALSAGDVFSIERGDGSVIQYRVVKTAVYDAALVDMSAVLSSIEPDMSALNLISCTGDVIDGTNDFSERVVVFSVQI